MAELVQNGRTHGVHSRFQGGGYEIGYLSSLRSVSLAFSLTEDDSVDVRTRVAAVSVLTLVLILFLEHYSSQLNREDSQRFVNERICRH